MSNANEFVIERGVLKKYLGSGGDVVIPEDVRAIGEKAFFFMPNIRNVIIPERVKSIGNNAFYRCTNLESVVLPKGITAISDGAFRYCTGLTSVAFPEGLISIGIEAFESCKSLGGVVIPESVKEIGERAFYGCIRFDCLRIPRNVITIGSKAFDLCKGLTEVTIEAEKVRGVKQAFPDSGGLLFLTTKLSSLSELQRLGAVERFAEKNGDIAEPYRSAYCKHIKSKAACYIKSAVQNQSLLELMCREELIPAQAYQAYLDAVQSGQNPQAVTLMQNYIADQNTSEKKTAKKEKTAKTKTVPDRKNTEKDVGDIAGVVFAVTGKLETFQTREHLKEFLLGKDAVLASSISTKVDYLIMNDPYANTEKKKVAEKLEITVITEQKFNAMAGRKFNISEDHVLVKYAGTDADVVIPEGVTAIGWQAFLGCEGLRSVVIPEGVTDIGGYAFCGCYNLETVAIPKSVTSIGFGAFEGCYNLERVAIPENVTSIGGRAFYDCRKIRQVTVPAGVTRLENGVFGDCCSLTDAKLPEGLTLIDAHAFGDCGNLECIVIPEGVTSIGYMAFDGFWGANGCSGLKQVTLPESIRKINKSAFDSKAKILFLTNKFSLLTPMQREQSVILFAEKGGECNEPYRSSYLKHIRSKAADYRESAMKHPALLELMHRENLIPAKDVQAYLKAAQTSGSAEAIALVLDYYANYLTASEKEKIEQGFYGESCLEEKF